MDDAVLRLVVADDDVDEASGLLWTTDPVAVTEVPGALIAGYPDRAAADRAVDALAGRWPATVEDPPDPAGWRDAWRAFAEPVVVGRVTVSPSWLPTPDGDLVVVLDPGQAFGSGSHPTTRMALAALQEEVRPGDVVLDLGCGSGVLAIAAALLGARVVVGVDIDPHALAATTQNAVRNGVVVEVGTEADGPADLVVANIGARTLVELAPTIEGVAPRLLLTGILAGHEADVAAAYPSHRLTGVDEEEGWVLIRLASVAGDDHADRPHR